MNLQTRDCKINRLEIHGRNLTALSNNNYVSQDSTFVVSVINDEIIQITYHQKVLLVTMIELTKFNLKSNHSSQINNLASNYKELQKKQFQWTVIRAKVI